MKTKTCIFHKAKMIPTAARYSIGKYEITQMAWKCAKTGHKVLESSEVDQSFRKVDALKQSFRLTDLPDRYLNFEGKVLKYLVGTKKPMVTSKELVAHFSTGNIRSTRALVSRSINRLLEDGTIREIGRDILDKRQRLYAFANLNEPQRLLRQP